MSKFSHLEDRPQFRRPKRRKRSREHRRLRLRRHGRRAYIRSVYFLPSLATLGNAVCGFGAIYVAALNYSGEPPSPDPVTNYFAMHSFAAAAYLIFAAMLFDAVDGRLARFTRHTTDFGGQLDSLADVVSFGAAPAFVALRLFRQEGPVLDPLLSRLLWAVAAIYLSCAAIRLARFNVSNEHGEQHHFSFLGLPSPGAAAAVAGLILMQQDLWQSFRLPHWLAEVALTALPVVVLCTGLLMVSNVRYPHLVNRYLRGRRPIGRLVVMLSLILLLVVWHQVTLGIGSLCYAFWGPGAWAVARVRRRGWPMQGNPS
jgi:CDP-diacylglycerol--serine O-phosphatidyltransferase